MQNVDNTQDVIDSRDVIDRLEDLQEDREALQEDIDTATTEDEENEAREALDDWLDENLAELKALVALQNEGSYYGDWECGEPLIRDTYFKSYAQELAEDCGMLEGLTHWPARCIDWDLAVWELQHDYMTVDFDGVDYWIHA